jgi:NAD(P)-dependent dehydrogenase (short-subunit alcohol dehydrogenase family)
MIDRKTVVVTGASSGIGWATVAKLARSGWHVFATVRKSSDADRLRAEMGDSVTPLLMDVTDRASITAAAEQVSSRLLARGLDALVNVAGIGMLRPLEYATAEEMREIFEINLFGQIAVTQAFLPLLRRARGRIVNIGSVGSHIAIPFGSLLNASKSAFRSMNDSLRMELRSSGVRVVMVEPGAIKTPAVNKTLGDVDGVIRSLPPAGAAEYSDMLKKAAARAYAMESSGSDPEVVAAVVMEALIKDRPRTHYPAGKHSRVLALLPILIPAALLDVLLLKALGLPTRRKTQRPTRIHTEGTFAIER